MKEIKTTEQEETLSQSAKVSATPKSAATENEGDAKSDEKSPYNAARFTKLVVDQKTGSSEKIRVG